MRKCPNCGRETARTEDWACQWCAYPLLSEPYENIPKTFKQLKEERLHKVEPEPELAAEREERAQKEADRFAKEKAEQEERVKEEAERQVEEKAEQEPEPKVETEPELAVERETEPVVEPEPELAAAIAELTIEELSSAFSADGVAAHEKLTNSTIKLTGNVDRIVVNEINNNYYITLTSAEKTGLRDVQCRFDKKHVRELKLLTKGETVTVQGKYAGYIIDILMRECALVR